MPCRIEPFDSVGDRPVIELRRGGVHSGAMCSRHRATERSIASFGAGGLANAASSASMSRSVSSRMRCSWMIASALSAMASVMKSVWLRPERATACSSLGRAHRSAGTRSAGSWPHALPGVVACCVSVAMASQHLMQWFVSGSDIAIVCLLYIQILELRQELTIVAGWTSVSILRHSHDIAPDGEGRLRCAGRSAWRVVDRERDSA